ncbi:hypothetical protein A1Q1_00471 [Trichosporon asahii var. asahii CBS 2479]|uniref:Uncharacterized protein n=1 Tax=Trichosporon asahii var. asahii (strain ATCC 90039 / CBS 2479 / JCM 2466 / KCTC 7840 / NBRC 103889/ NCYC 2677 / UAMH 7654) TaxID=1186058 RepID=J5TCG6_TRIAS|nr:hypothetical protein A1Q1_00471 [Trichosporon asahii var. asahii CBS 2479]EJT50261.1 hypothetical protein A1Q1_00471 [Trichosporon asahii var. asahii CBS 2479]
MERSASAAERQASASERSAELLDRIAQGNASTFTPHAASTPSPAASREDASAVLQATSSSPSSSTLLCPAATASDSQKDPVLDSARASVTADAVSGPSTTMFDDSSNSSTAAKSTPLPSEAAIYPSFLTGEGGPSSTRHSTSARASTMAAQGKEEAPRKTASMSNLSGKVTNATLPSPALGSATHPDPSPATTPELGSAPSPSVTRAHFARMAELFAEGGKRFNAPLKGTLVTVLHNTTAAQRIAAKIGATDVDSRNINFPLPNSLFKNGTILRGSSLSLQLEFVDPISDPDERYAPDNIIGVVRDPNSCKVLSRYTRADLRTSSAVSTWNLTCVWMSSTVQDHELL